MRGNFAHRGKYFWPAIWSNAANDMGPAELEAAARALAKRYGAKVSV